MVIQYRSSLIILVQAVHSISHLRLLKPWLFTLLLGSETSLCSTVPYPRGPRRQSRPLDAFPPSSCLHGDQREPRPTRSRPGLCWAAAAESHAPITRAEARGIIDEVGYWAESQSLKLKHGTSDPPELHGITRHSTKFATLYSPSCKSTSCKLHGHAWKNPWSPPLPSSWKSNKYPSF